jgi:energy-coupling factor transporter ATP-binding protein EcfA2
VRAASRKNQPSQKLPAGTERAAPPEARPFGRLLHYSVTGLFGQHRHEFDLEQDEPTILTGANGTGKSTILRTINAVGAGAWHELTTLPFKSLKLKFESVPQLKITRLDDVLKVEQGDKTWRLDSRMTTGRYLLPGDPAQRFEPAETDWDVDEPVAVRPEMWRAVQQQMYVAAARERWVDVKGRAAEAEPPEWLENLPRRFPVRFVTDQRLVLYPKSDPRSRGQAEFAEEIQDAVTTYSQDLRRQIQMRLSTYGRRTQEEDRAFPRRFVEAAVSAGADEVDLGELDSLIRSVSERQEALQSLGLWGDFDTPLRLDPASLKVSNVPLFMKIFFESTLRKLESLEDFRRRLQLFVDFLNAHFVDKIAIPVPERRPRSPGLVFAVGDGSTLPPADLSSGEQQMLVLAYQLLFKAPQKSLLLVDEPEISLHVGWQSSLVEDIAEMARARKLQVIVATHSPVLIGDREDLKRSLDRPARR